MRQETRRQISIAAPDIGAAEEEAVLRVLRSGRLVQGPEVAALEEEFSRASGVAHTVAVSNGTAALHVALHRRSIVGAFERRGVVDERRDVGKRFEHGTHVRSELGTG